MSWSGSSSSSATVARPASSSSTSFPPTRLLLGPSCPARSKCSSAAPSASSWTSSASSASKYKEPHYPLFSGFTHCGDLRFFGRLKPQQQEREVALRRLQLSGFFLSP